MPSFISVPFNFSKRLLISRQQEPQIVLGHSQEHLGKQMTLYGDDTPHIHPVLMKAYWNESLLDGNAEYMI